MADTQKVVARMLAAPAHVQALIEEMKRLVEEVRREDGCLSYELYRGEDDTDVLVFVEEWASRAQWEAHMRGPALAGFNERLGAGWIASGEVHALARVV